MRTAPRHCRTTSSRVWSRRVDDDVLAADASRSRKVIGDRRVERLLLLKRASFGAGDLHHHQFLAMIHSEKGWRADHAPRGGVCGDDLEIVVDGDVEGFHHRPVNALRQFANEVRGLAFDMGNANERHLMSPQAACPTGAAGQAAEATAEPSSALL
jgi:hypothetical protein